MAATPETRSLKLANLEVLINTILYNAAAALALINSHGEDKLKTFFTEWFELLKDESSLPRVHDKKLSILAMCGLLTLDGSQIPQSLQEGWTGIVAGILVVFKTLPKAVAGKHTMVLRLNVS
jgi:hypothetical protein